MKKFYLLFLIPFFYLDANAQCEVTTSATSTTVRCGRPVSLSAFGQSGGTMILNETFNSGGFGPGWGSTPGATNFSNPCSSGGVDGTTHAWMDNNTSVPRTLVSSAYNLLSATAGVTICFDLMFAEQGDNAPCEGPDEPDEGVYLQYSIDGGANWIDIHYFDPNGGNDPQLVNWNNWCFPIPTAAITGSTLFRWHQTADSGADYDHWGIDNVQIYQNDVNATLIWLHDGYSYGTGNPGGTDPTPVVPTTTTTYTAQLTTGTGAVCTQSVTVTVLPPLFDIDIAATPNPICIGDCANITATAQEIISPASTPTFENNEFSTVFGGNAGVNINVTGLNMTSLTNGSIVQVVINSFNYGGVSFCTSFGGCPCPGGPPVGLGQPCNLSAANFTITLTSPGGCTIILAPAGVATGNYSGTVFVPVGGTAIGGSFPTGGPWAPNQPFSNLNGCDPNGVWTLSVSAGGAILGAGVLTGWSIQFNDPAIYGPVTYAWSPTTNMTGSNTLTPTVCPPATTTYSLTASNPTPGCPTGTESITITVNNCACATPPPATITNPPAVCAPATVNLSSAVSGTGTGVLTYYATSADATASTNPLGSSTVSASGTYYVRVQDPTDPACFNVQPITVTINPAITVSVTPTAPVICPGGSTSLTAGGAGTGTYAWANATGLSATSGVTVTANPATTTTYTVTGTNGGCSASSTVTVTVSNNLTISVTPVNPTICPGGSVSLAASGAGTTGTYAWANATGLSATSGATVTANPATTTTYTVTGTSGTCTADTTVTVIVSSNILVSVTPPSATICPGGSVSLTASGAGTTGTYAWANATGLSATSGATVTASPATTTTYTVTGTSGTCTADTTVTVTVSNNLTVSVTPPSATICPGGSVSLTASGAGTGTYAWANATGLSATSGATVTANPATTTTYTVTGTNGTCTADTTVTVTVSNNIVISVTPPSASICAGGSVSLTASGAGTTGMYTWANATGLSATSGATVTANPAATTTYTVTGTSGTCTADTTVTITVVPNLIVTVTPASSTICEGAAVGLTAGGGAATYSWANATGLSSTSGATVTANPTTTTTYTVTGASGSCSADTTVTITVIPLPVLTVDATPPGICAGSSSTLSATGAATFLWSPSATLSSSSGSSVTATPATTTVYTVIGSNGTCNANANVTVTVTPVTVADAGLNDTICAGQSVLLSASGGNTYVWTPPFGLSDPNSPNPVATPPVTMTYTVAVSNSGLCASTDVVTVFVNPLPAVSAGPDALINIGETVILQGYGDSLMWTEDFNTLSCYECPTPSANPIFSSTYVLTAADTNGCVNRDTVFIEVTQESALYVPSAITPNGDGTNDIFYAEGYGIKEFHMMIFNRWGEKIFESRRLTDGWNGTFKGEIVEQDVYTYTILATPYVGGKMKRIGSVTVVR